MNIRPAILLLSVFLPISASYAQPLAQLLREDLQSPQRVAGIQGGDTLRMAALLSRYYAGRYDAPGWIDESGPLLNAQQLMNAVRDSRNDGLDPANYHFHALTELLDALHEPQLTSEVRQQRLAALELFFSDAFLLLDLHASRGKVNAHDMTPELVKPADAAALMEQLGAVMNGTSPEMLIASLEPHEPGYSGLREALARYRVRMAAGGFPGVPAGATLREGDSGPRVAALIARLDAEGDLKQGEVKDSRTIYGPAVTAAVKRFQAQRGLQSDGIAGSATIAAMNEPVSDLIDRVRVNMERWRWLPRNLPATRVMVNIAGFNATLFDQGQTVMQARVIVGLPAKQTPEFKDQIRYLVINPSWDVPASIAGEELLPKVQADSNYLKRHGYTVLQGWGAAEHEVDPATVDWKQWTADTLPYHFRQAPGPENPLGKVKFVFPNAFDVYMHDTPAQELFASSRCAFSHGCIRVSHAMDLAAALLKLDGRPDPPAFLARAVASGQTQRVDLTHPVPIYIIYMTTWVDGSGVLEFSPDVYERDPELLHALNAPLPENPVCCTAFVQH